MVITENNVVVVDDDNRRHIEKRRRARKPIYVFSLSSLSLSLAASLSRSLARSKETIGKPRAEIQSSSFANVGIISIDDDDGEESFSPSVALPVL